MPETTSAYIENLLIKELAFTYPDVVMTSSANAVDLIKNLENEFRGVYDNIKLIHPEKFENVSSELVEDAKFAVLECVEEIGKNLISASKEHGKEELFSFINPVKTDPILYSERIGLSGMPAKLVCHAGNVVPSIIKTGKYPENGVWNNDRLQIAALSMLAEEEYEKTAGYGFVEYARYGIVRKVNVRANDRRQILKILSRVKKIKDGTMPDKKESSLCEHCTFLEMCGKCSTKVSLASKFF